MHGTGINHNESRGDKVDRLKVECSQDIWCPFYMSKKPITSIVHPSVLEDNNATAKGNLNILLVRGVSL